MKTTRALLVVLTLSSLSVIDARPVAGETYRPPWCVEYGWEEWRDELLLPLVQAARGRIGERERLGHDLLHARVRSEGLSLESRPPAPSARGRARWLAPVAPPR
jgi:hypothetical protein